ncbi:uncharacterized protein BDZ99DRAFT_453758 [Mytilinidion resinicola]|uniref:BTB domain-containing protein n=1 Tax=Mytilinidion resinicola TaxID=574789 RepID=A0A6A6Y4I8_9PEZI|nr:uncharacterized protein BDZ99DRAFT_453758 [Mytilinidion resinicola]KAF2803433.1 hypothetical protein BDZ99DRAFT_453758 [Mytilinidion resinicola]
MDTIPDTMDENTVSPTNGTSDLSRLDPNGDVILRIESQHDNATTSFQVSSKVLRLASPYFVRMFGPCFQEGLKLLQGEFPVIDLNEDDAPSMSIVLNRRVTGCHYRGVCDTNVMTAERLAGLAVQCDKYDCVTALTFWFSVWFKSVGSVRELSPEEFGFLLLAALLINDSGKFTEISERALREVTIAFSSRWEQHEILTILPTSIPGVSHIEVSAIAIRADFQTGAITACITRTLRKFEAELQAKCHPCHNTALSPKYCTSETRIAEYFAILRKVELWPTAKPFGVCSVSDIVFRFTCAKADLKHSCAAGTGCPLLTNLDALSRRVDRIFRDTTGLCLHCIRKDDEWDEYQKCVHT